MDNSDLITRVIEGSDDFTEDDREGLEEVLDTLEEEMGNDSIIVYRGMSVDDSVGLAKKIAKGKKPAGDFWAYMEESATSYVGGEGANIVIEGRVSNKNVNWEETLAYNYKFPDETEIRIDEGGEDVEVIRVQYEEWNEGLEKNEWKTIQSVKKDEEKTKSGEVKVKSHTRSGGKVVAHTRSHPTKDRAFFLREGDDLIAQGVVFADNGTVVVYFNDEWGVLYKSIECFTEMHSGDDREITFADYPVESYTKGDGTKVRKHTRGEGEQQTADFHTALKAVITPEMKEQYAGLVPLPEIAAKFKELGVSWNVAKKHLRELQESRKIDIQIANDPSALKPERRKFGIEFGGDVMGKRLGFYVALRDDEFAWTDCPRRLALVDEAILGYAPLTPFFDHVGEIQGKSSDLKGVIRSSVILAREMIQSYHIREFPTYMQDALKQKYGADLKIVRVLKPYEELVKAISNVTSIPITMYHTPEMFPGDDHRAVIGKVTHLVKDDKLRAIKGVHVLSKNRCPENHIKNVASGKVIAVSIGGQTGFGPGGKLDNQIYHLSQIGIKIGHLADLPGKEGRCPRGKCGINMGDVQNLNVGISDKKSLGHFLDMSTFSAALEPRFYGLDSAFADLHPPTAPGSSLNRGEINILNNGYNEPESQFMTDEEIKKILAENATLKKDLATVKDANYASRIEDLEANATKLETEKETLASEALALKDENEVLKGDLTAKQALLDESDAKEKVRLVDALSKTTHYKIKENLAKLQDEDLKTVRIRHETLLGASVITLKDAAIHQRGFLKPGEEEVNQMAGLGNDKGRTAILDMGMDGELPEVPE